MLPSPTQDGRERRVPLSFIMNEEQPQKEATLKLSETASLPKKEPVDWE